MPTSLFQYEMLPTTWFYLSSLMIVAVFFRFNRVFSVRNLDILTMIFLTPGLIYIAMGSAPQGYLWLALIGAFGFSRLVFDSLLRRRPMLEPNLNVAGLTFACVAASAFIVPNLWLNRGDFAESPRAWRLEQILTAADANDENAVKVEERPGFRPFLRAAEKTNRFFAPSAEAWIRAASSSATETTNAESTLYFFGTAIRVDGAPKRSDDGEKASRAIRAMRWAAGRGGENEFAPVGVSGDAEKAVPATEFVGASVAPTAPVAPSVSGSGVERAPATAPIPEPIPTPPMRDVYRLTPSDGAADVRDGVFEEANGASVRTPSFERRRVADRSGRFDRFDRTVSFGVDANRAFGGASLFVIAVCEPIFRVLGSYRSGVDVVDGGVVLPTTGRFGVCVGDGGRVGVLSVFPLALVVWILLETRRGAFRDRDVGGGFDVRGRFVGDDGRGRKLRFGVGGDVGAAVALFGVGERTLGVLAAFLPRSVDFVVRRFLRRIRALAAAQGFGDVDFRVGGADARRSNLDGIPRRALYGVVSAVGGADGFSPQPLRPRRDDDRRRYLTRAAGDLLNGSGKEEWRNGRKRTFSIGRRFNGRV